MEQIVNSLTENRTKKEEIIPTNGVYLIDREHHIDIFQPGLIMDRVIRIKDDYIQDGNLSVFQMCHLNPFNIYGSNMETSLNVYKVSDIGKLKTLIPKYYHSHIGIDEVNN